MPFTLPALPYARNALEPQISENTINFHYGKHHQNYVNTLNTLLPETESTLEDLIKTATGPVFNNAAQVWNHTFYWNSLSEVANQKPTGELLEAIVAKWGSYEQFIEAFTKVAATHFGSGWAWLVKDKNNELSLISTHDAANPIRDGFKPILCCDVWEHAYYLDYQNARPAYLKNFFERANWKFALENYKL
ncbi:hypothetical protein WA158_004481 [Blastocystis sp. Blastoise]